MSYFEIGIYQPKTVENVGTLWRSAYQLGAAGVFTIGKRYKRQPGDTYNTAKQIHLKCFQDLEEFLLYYTNATVLVGIEIGGMDLNDFKHPERAVYLLGAEDTGLHPEVLSRCQSVISLQAIKQPSFNVAIAGSIVMYHRNFWSTLK